MDNRIRLLTILLMMPGMALAAAAPAAEGTPAVQQKRLVESDRKVEAGRLLLKWGGYVEKIEGRDRKAWAAALWPSLAAADLDNLRKAMRAVTYEGMLNALLGQRPTDAQVIDRMAKASPGAGGAVTKALGNLAADLVFTPITPCRIVDTRNIGGRITAGSTRDLNAANPGGSFNLQGGDASDCGIPANPAALALSVTGLGNTSTGYLRIYPFNGTSAQGSPVPLDRINTTATNDMIVPTSQGSTQELKVFSTATTHYAAFVTGYFMAPAATALECTTSPFAGFTVPDTAPRVVGTSLACPVGYTKTDLHCLTTTSVALVGIGYDSCYFADRAPGDGAAGNGTVYSTCCRLPGR